MSSATQKPVLNPLPLIYKLWKRRSRKISLMISRQSCNKRLKPSMLNWNLPCLCLSQPIITLTNKHS